MLALACSGCVHRSPLLVPDQTKLIKSRDKYLKSNARAVQEQIRVAGTVGGLVVVPQTRSSAPVVIPADDPLNAAKTNPDALKGGESCIFVFRSTAAMEPEEISCQTLTLRVQEILASQAHEDQQEEKLSKLRSDLETLKQQVSDIAEALKHDEENIRNAQSDIKSLGTISATTANLVSFHEVQLKNAEKTLRSLVKGYNGVSKTVGENNRQIESLINDMNNSFSNVQQTLDEIQQRLGMIH
jgi:hypothetical protein